MTHYRTKEEIAKEHLTQYYYHKGRGINLDDILPMSRILPMMEEYALPLKSENERLKAELERKDKVINEIDNHCQILIDSNRDKGEYSNPFVSGVCAVKARWNSLLPSLKAHPIEDRAVEFTEWLWKNEFYRKQVSVNPPIWKKGYYNELEYTTPELYQIFLKETSSNVQGKE